MKQLTAALLVLVSVSAALCYVDLEAQYDPHQANYAMQAVAQSDRQQTVLDLADKVGALQKKLYYQQPQYEERKRPVLSPLFDDLVHSLKGVQKSIDKQHKDHPATNPNEMAMYRTLMSGLRKSNKRLDPKPAPLPVNTNQIEALRRLIYQSNQVSRNVETPELRNMHDRAHAQARMLHRLTHAVESMGDTLDASKQTHYDQLLGMMMHHHLADRHYLRDPLHDHLLAHHIERNHRDEEFADHLAHHVLFNNLDTHIEHDRDVDRSIGSFIADPLTQKEAELANLGKVDLDKAIAADKARQQQYRQQMATELKARAQPNPQQQQQPQLPSLPQVPQLPQVPNPISK